MQNPNGQIISISPDASSKQVVVEVAPDVVCERCASGKGCGAGLMGRKPGDKHVTAILADNLNVRMGDQVSIELEPSNVLRAAGIVYGYPLLGAVVSVAIAYSASASDVAAAMAALTGLVVGMVLARLRLNRARCLRDFTPMVVERLSGAAD